MFLDRIYAHLVRKAIVYLWLLVLFVAFSRYFMFVINVSDSLPGTIFVIQKGAHPQKGDFAAFKYQGGGPYDRGALFLKVMKGVPGATVSASEQANGYIDYFVDGVLVGTAKPLSKQGRPLKAGPTGVIPPGSYYMAASSPDSLDSRYDLVGWVQDSQIVGEAYRIY